MANQGQHVTPMGRSTFAAVLLSGVGLPMDGRTARFVRPVFILLST